MTEGFRARASAGPAGEAFLRPPQEEGLAAEPYGDHDFYFPRPGAVVAIPYQASLRQGGEGPAEALTRAEARVYRRGEALPEFLLRVLPLRRSGRHELLLALDGLDPAADGPLRVDLSFEIEHRSAGPKRGLREQARTTVFVALAEPAVASVVASPERPRAGETVRLRVDRWGALVYDRPGAPRFERGEEAPVDPGRLPPGTAERVVWQRRGKGGDFEEVGRGEVLERPWRSEDRWGEQVYRAFVGEQPTPPAVRLRGGGACLQLLYEAPCEDGTFEERPFPPGLEVELRGAAGALEGVRSGSGGVLEFDLDPERSWVALALRNDEGSWVAVPPGERPPTLLGDDLGAGGLLPEGWCAFRLPARLPLAAVATRVVGAREPVRFDARRGAFVGLEEAGALLGCPEEPVRVVLRPDWHCLRFVYADRWLRRRAPSSVPARAVEGCAPLVVSGWAAGGREDPAFADTRCVWPLLPTGTADDHELVWALPWWRSRRADPEDARAAEPGAPDPGDGSAPAAAGPACVGFDIEAAAPFVEVRAGERRRVDLGASERRTAVDAERLRFYDLPRAWRSRGAWGKRGAEGVLGPWERLQGARGTVHEPIVFSLDALVPTAEDLAPRGFAPREAGSVDAALLHRDGWTRLADPAAELADPPPGTRLLRWGEELYAVFARRVPPSASRCVGARAAVRLDGGDGTPPSGGDPYHLREANCVAEAPLPWGECTAQGPGVPAGRCERILLRCCDRVEDREVARCLQVLRLSFCFRDAPAGSAPGERARELLRALEARWNGEDGHGEGDGPPWLEADEGPRVELRWLLVASSPERAHLRVEVVPGLERAWIDGAEGVGAWPWEAFARPWPAAVASAARWVGRAAGLPEEAPVGPAAASAGTLGWTTALPGEPYREDRPAGHASLLGGGTAVRARTAWPAAEWCARALELAPRVRWGARVVCLPPGPNPARSRLLWPLAVGRRGGAELVLYGLGADAYAAEVLAGAAGAPPADGLLSVGVRVLCEGLPRAPEERGSGSLGLPGWLRTSLLRRALLDALGAGARDVTERGVFVRGTLPAGGGSPLRRCALRFDARFLDVDAAAAVPPGRERARVEDAIEAARRRYRPDLVLRFAGCGDPAGARWSWEDEAAQVGLAVSAGPWRARVEGQGLAALRAAFRDALPTLLGFGGVGSDAFGAAHVRALARTVLPDAEVASWGEEAEA